MLSRCLVKPRNSCILWGRRKTHWLRRVGEPPCPKAGGLISAGSPAARPAAAGTQRGGAAAASREQPGPSAGLRGRTGGDGAAPDRAPAAGTGQRRGAPRRGGSAQERTPAPRIPRGGRGGGRIRVGSGAPLPRVPAPGLGFSRARARPQRGFTRARAPYGYARACARTCIPAAASCALQISTQCLRVPPRARRRHPNARFARARGVAGFLGVSAGQAGQEEGGRRGWVANERPGAAAGGSEPRTRPPAARSSRASNRGVRGAAAVDPAPARPRAVRIGTLSLCFPHMIFPPSVYLWFSTPVA